MRGGFLAIDADADEARVLAAGRAEHVESRAISKVDLESELLRRFDHLEVVVDGGHVHPFGQQHLTQNLAEPAEADEQHRALRSIEGFVAPANLFTDEPRRQCDEQRRERHAHGDRGDQQRRLFLLHHARGNGSGEEDESEFAALRQVQGRPHRRGVIAPTTHARAHRRRRP